MKKICCIKWEELKTQNSENINCYGFEVKQSFFLLFLQSVVLIIIKNLKKKNL